MRIINRFRIRAALRKKGRLPWPIRRRTARIPRYLWASTRRWLETQTGSDCADALAYGIAALNKNLRDYKGPILVKPNPSPALSFMDCKFENLGQSGIFILGIDLASKPKRDVYAWIDPWEGRE